MVGSIGPQNACNSPSLSYLVQLNIKRDLFLFVSCCPVGVEKMFAIFAIKGPSHSNLPNVDYVA